MGKRKSSVVAPPERVMIFWCPTCGHFALNQGKNPSPICADPACGCRCKFRRIPYVKQGASLAEGKAAAPDTRGMGDVQWSVLRSLVQHKSWSPGCGWLWDTRNGTIKLMEALVKRGLATKERVAVLRYRDEPMRYHDEYRPSPSAEEALVKKGLLKAS